MIILDTDIFSLLQADRDPSVPALAARIRAAGDEVWVSIVSYEEEMRGWLSFLAKAGDEAKRVFAYDRLKEMLDDFSEMRIVPYDKEASFHFVRLRQAKIRLATMDLRIAAIALAHSATMITRNVRDFAKVPGLKVEDWTKD